MKTEVNQLQKRRDNVQNKIEKNKLLVKIFTESSNWPTAENPESNMEECNFLSHQALPIFSALPESTERRNRFPDVATHKMQDK